MEFKSVKSTISKLNGHTQSSIHTLAMDVFDIKQDKTETPSKDVMRRPH
jgi:hypothetical protein